MNDVILVQPKSYGYSELIGNKYIPLGLISASFFLKDTYNVKIIDQRFKDWKKILFKELKKNPICVGVTSITGKQIKSALEISQIVKSNTDSKIVWGGVHPTLLPEQTLKNKLIDYVVYGEGEITFYELVQALDKNYNLKNIRGLCYKKDERIIKNKKRENINLNIISTSFKLINLKRYIKKNRAVLFETSRGCGYGCSYCIKSREEWRAKNPKNILDQINAIINDCNIRKIWFVDDNFFLKLNRINELMDNIIKERINFEWDVPGTNIASLRKMDDSFIKKMEKTGCNKLYIGIESGSNMILKKINKNITTKEILDVNRKLSRYNLKIIYNFMAGFPNETNIDMKETVKLMYRLKKENKNAMMSPLYFYTPYPNTKMYYESKLNGFKEPDNLIKWNNFEWRKINLPWIKDRKKLERLYFLSLFMDNKYNQEVNSNSIKTAIKFLKPFISFYFNRKINKIL